MKLQATWIKRAAFAAVAIAGLAYVLLVPPAGARSLRQFDADRMADLELRMWQAYYAKQNVRLFGLLVTTLREQYRYSWMVAAREGFHLARAASRFGNATGHYEDVLPDLEAAYTTARDWLQAGFDPREVARAELSWWVARRTPGEDSVAAVGWLIADEYSLLYEVPRDRVENAALLRALAASMRDEQAAQPDWATIGELLNKSYRELLASLNTLNARAEPYRESFFFNRSLRSLPSASRT